MEENESSKCVLCGKPSDLVCQRCLDTYCSIKCQVTDWPRHRQICFGLPDLMERSLAIRSRKPVQMLGNSSRILRRSSTDSSTESLAQAAKQRNSVKKVLPKSSSPSALPFKNKEINGHSPKDAVGDVLSKQKSNPRSALLQKLMKASGQVQTENKSGETVTEKKEPWMSHVSLKEITDEPIEILINSFDANTKSGYILLEKYEQACMKSVREINKAISEQPQLAADEIKVNKLCAVFHDAEDIYYRGVITSVSGDKIEVQLLDFGDKLVVTADKLKAPVELMKEQPAYAISVMFQNAKQTLKSYQRLMVKFLNKDLERKLVEIVDETNLNSALAYLKTKKMTVISAQLRKAFNEKVFIVSVQYPNIDPDSYKLNEETVAGLEETNVLEPGTLIVIKRTVNEFARASIIMFDEVANACIVYLCDYGTFDTLIPLPSKVKLCPVKMALLPSRTMFVQATDMNVTDKATILRDFLKPNAMYKIKIMIEENEATGIILLEGTVFGSVKLYDKVPELSVIGLHFWPMSSPTNTPVTILRTRVDTVIRALIIPTDKLEVFEHAILGLSKQLPYCNEAPKIGEMVIYENANAIPLRAVAVKNVSNNMIEVRGLENGNTYNVDWKQLKVPTNLLKNLPVYTMNVSLNDFTDFQQYNIDDIKTFFDQPQLKKREYLLSYEGHHSSGVKLITNPKTNETLGTQLKAYLEKIALEKGKIEEENKKKELEKQKLAEEMERKKQAEMETQKQKYEIRPLKENTPKNPKTFFENMSTIKLPVGKIVKLIFVDIMPENNLVAVCEDTTENTEFLFKILATCRKYVETPGVQAGYEPETGEMCLLLFEDEEWYRATCIQVQDKLFTMQTVDFGTIITVPSNNLIKMPEFLAKEPIRTHFATGLDEQQLSKFDQLSKCKCLIESQNDDVYCLKLV